MEQTPRTIIFDLDGTLYEDETIFDVYAEELSKFVAPERRSRFLSDWEAAKAGRGVAAIGLGYEEASDRLFRFEDNRITAYVGWDGRVTPVEAEDSALSAAGASLFGGGRFNIGDFWWLPVAIAAHHGVSTEEQRRAFLATRAVMGSKTYALEPVPGGREMLRRLGGQGFTLIAMTNSPPETTNDVLRRLGIFALFDQIRPAADKPAGLSALLAGGGLRCPVLSVGDNYVNDIAPCLRAGGFALYIDRHDTRLGAGRPRCARVRTATEMVAWLDRM